MARIRFESVGKRYPNGFVALENLSLDVADREFVVLLGPSGCGKSTTLNLIAGLEDVTAGSLWFDETLMNVVPAHKRDVAMVFQSYALYPHKSVYENIAFGLRMRGHPRAEIESRVREAARALDIEPLLERRPHQLSGGQRQRVALGRALVRQPQAFLMDEPLSNLDAKLRVQMRTEIKELHQRLKTTSVYVTHDQIEAMTMADKIVVMNGGKVEQIGTPLELYDHPANLFVAGFIGSPAMNFLSGKLVTEAAGRGVRIAQGCVLPAPANREADGRDVIIGVRPEHFDIGESCVKAQIVVVEPTGADTQVYCRIAGQDITAVSRERHTFRPGDTVDLKPAEGKSYLFDPASGARIA
jgi:multiple sugar transport system ATP-binding protein